MNQWADPSMPVLDYAGSVRPLASQGDSDGEIAAFQEPFAVPLAPRVCQPELRISPTGDLFNGSRNPADAVARMLDKADAAAGQPITHWCVDLGFAYFSPTGNLRVQIPRKYLQRSTSTSRRRVYRELLPEWDAIANGPNVPGTRLDRRVRDYYEGRGGGSPQRGGLFFEDRTEDAIRLVLRTVYGSSPLFDTYPMPLVGGDNCGWSGPTIRRLLSLGPPVRVQHAFWDAGLGPGRVPAQARVCRSGTPPQTCIQNPISLYTRTNGDAVANPQAEAYLANLIAADRVRYFVRPRIGYASPTSFLGAQEALFAHKQAVIAASTLLIGENGQAASSGIFPPGGERHSTGVDLLAYCDGYRNTNVRFDRPANSLPDAAGCSNSSGRSDTFLARNVGNAILMGNNEGAMRGTIADYYLWIAASIVSWSQELPAPSRRAVLPVAAAAAKTALAHIVAIGMQYLHELSHYPELCGAGHCCIAANKANCARDPRGGKDCGNDLPGRLWRYFISAYCGLPLVDLGTKGTANSKELFSLPVQIETHPLPFCQCAGGTWGSELASLGIRLNRGATSFNGIPLSERCGYMYAVHWDYWRPKSRSVVRWNNRPTCASLEGIRTGGVQYFEES